jgi:organic radical activating enzyme
MQVAVEPWHRMCEHPFGVCAQAIGGTTMVNQELPEQSQNAVKDPDNWVTGGEPMTGPQASYLKTLLQQAGKEEEFDPEMTKADASKLIDQLQEETGRGA